MILGVWGHPEGLLEPSWKQVPKNSSKDKKNHFVLGGLFEIFSLQADSKKNIIFRLPLERAQRDICTHLGAQSEHMGSKMEHFGCILKAFSQVDGNSDFRYPSAAIFKKTGLQGIPRSCFLVFFQQLHPGTSQRVPRLELLRIFADFEDFWMPQGFSLELIFCLFSTSFPRSKK